MEVVAILFCLGCKSLMRIWVQGRGGESEIRSFTELSPSQRAIILLKESISYFISKSTLIRKLTGSSLSHGGKICLSPENS